MQLNVLQKVFSVYSIDIRMMKKVENPTISKYIQNHLKYVRKKTKHKRITKTGVSKWNVFKGYILNKFGYKASVQGPKLWFNHKAIFSSKLACFVCVLSWAVNIMLSVHMRSANWLFETPVSTRLEKFS
jgi:hypothetical protein